MKILFVTDDLYQGGAERQLCLLACGMKRRGHEVLMAQYDNVPVFYSGILGEADVDVVALECGDSEFRRISKLKSLVRVWAPDVVVSFKESANWVTSISAVSVECPVIVSERNTYPPGLKLGFIDRLKFRSFRNVGAVVSNSHSQADFIRDRFPKLTSKLHTINNMIGHEFINTPISVKRKTKRGPLRFLTLGRVSFQKNIINMVELSNSLRNIGVDFRYDWYGRVEDGDLYDEAAALIEAYGLQGMFNIHPETKDVIPVLDGADLFILPSLWEGFSNVLCEAMARRVPVVASDVADNAFIVGRPDRMFDPQDGESMVRAVLGILNTPCPRLREECMSNRMRVAGLCSEAKFLDAYEGLFEEVLRK